MTLAEQQPRPNFTKTELRDCARRETRVLRLRYQRWLTRRRPRHQAMREVAMMEAIVEVLEEMAERER